MKKYRFLYPAIFIKDEDGHYQVLSAFQKSIRGSDVDAALHYLARLIVAGDLDYADNLLVEIDHICLLNKFTKQNPTEIDIKVHALKVDKLVSNAKLAAKKGQEKLCL